MTDEEIKDAIDNMSEEELNEYIFFTLKEMTKKYETAQVEIEKKDKIIDEMAIALYDEWYMPALNTTEKIKEYFKNKVETEEK